jgi:hypothetical protein
MEHELCSCISINVVVHVIANVEHHMRGSGSDPIFELDEFSKFEYEDVCAPSESII